ncbi:type VI secretion system protein IglI family protein [Haliangium ochraceum]|uniref:ImpA N-terminal domain-containing protein n=1 Tax=Haliangium ochraceum (strain DSM 14365 / JCM 11303 / SMP-2) TaxID=502025 RepID=D0LHF0_HALO1|nr:type VI secretion system protein IglI family protein [Haliangium ochraceum]ACY12812.1 hypothetical protein Hoch_0171 [Haliangium ochraceum DSM 14365]
MPSLDPSVLDGPLRAVSPGVIDLAVEDSSVHRVSQLAHRGEVIEAAQQAEALLADRVYDMRLIGYFLFGVFLERGLAYLPDLLYRIRDLLMDDFAALGPNRRKPRVVDAVLLWLFQSIDARARFHADFQDETWQAWLDDSGSGLSKRIVASVAEVQQAATTRLDEPQCAPALLRLRLWIENDFARALVRQHQPAASVTTRPLERARASERPVARAPERLRQSERPRQSERAHAGERPREFDRSGEPSVPLSATEEAAPARPARTTLVGTAPGPMPANPLPAEVGEVSPAMQELLRKLRGFSNLVQRGDYAKAAVIANDLRQIIENFDPVVFLPRLFVDYFRNLNGSIAEILPHWEAMGSPSWKALEQFYRVDLESFLDE